MTQGYVRSAIARDLRFEQGLVGTAIAQSATFERTSAVLVLIAKDVEGDIKTLVDWRGALAFGAAVGLLVGILRRR